MQRIDGQQNIINKPWEFSPQSKVTPQGQAKNPLQAVQLDPAFVVELAARKKEPPDTQDVELVFEEVDVEEREKESRRGECMLYISMGMQDLQKPWDNYAHSAWTNLKVNRERYERGYTMLLNGLSKYMEKIGVDDVFRGICSDLLDELKDSDPKGENKLNSYAQDILQKAMRGEKLDIEKEQKNGKKAYEEEFHDQIKQLEDEDAALLDRQREKVIRLNQQSRKNIAAKMKQIQKLYKDMQEVNRGNFSEEGKKGEIAMIQKQIDVIREEISKIQMINFKDVMRSENF